MREPLVVVPYDPTWPDAFQQIREKIGYALGDLALDILHVGSTSVPGLAAKPIIDIDVVVSTESDLASAIRELSAIGYAHEGDLGVHGRHAFAQPANLPPHHLYVCEAGSPELKRHIMFRDYLRKNPDAAEAYAALKQQLAEQFPSSRNRYTTAKTAFVENALGRLATTGDSDL